MVQSTLGFEQNIVVLNYDGQYGHIILQKASRLKGLRHDSVELHTVQGVYCHFEHICVAWEVGGRMCSLWAVTVMLAGQRTTSVVFDFFFIDLRVAWIYQNMRCFDGVKSIQCSVINNNMRERMWSSFRWNLTPFGLSFRVFSQRCGYEKSLIRWNVIRKLRNRDHALVLNRQSLCIQFQNGLANDVPARPNNTKQESRAWT